MHTDFHLKISPQKLQKRKTINVRVKRLSLTSKDK
jgi:hypothetical protein